MNKEHQYNATIVWTGNKGEGTTNYKAYERSHIISIKNKPDIQASSDAPFLGDITKHNPEDMLLASLSTCHMLWYLHLCADNGIVVISYTDEATATMLQTDKGGHFTFAILNPQVIITDSLKIEQANRLHTVANEHCFIANSVNFPVHHKPVCIAQ